MRNANGEYWVDRSNKRYATKVRRVDWLTNLEIYKAQSFEGDSNVPHKKIEYPI